MHANNILDIVRVTPRNRKPQWTHKETQHLIREFDKRKLLLRPKPGEVVSSASKHRAWVEIAQAVNLTNPHVHRTVSEVQKKWQNLCLRTKKDKDGLPVDSLFSAVSRADQAILEEQQSQHPPALSIQPRPLLIQPYQSAENSGGNGTHSLVPVKIEKVDSVDEMMRTNHVDTAGDSRPESTRSQLSYNDVEFINPTTQPEYDMYATSSGIVHAAHDPEAVGSVPTIIPTSESPRGQKRKHGNMDDTTDSYSYTIGDTELLDVRRNLMMAEMQKYKLECEKIRTEKDKLLLETEKIMMEKEKLMLELQTLRATSEEFRVSQNKSVSQLEKERMSLENEKLVLEIENMRSLHKTAVEKTQLEKQRYSLENDKLNIEIQNLRGSNRTSSYQGMM
ncbi:myb/SANT-like DNA-binding domain-containing protein 4 [Pecten maximus]|uniref:myb/SANT-like DNA-binding domain-containing protein 4 n=1 Tax=Pecten maximus TaxID=6579 RepID=UPI00145813D3|nr:myb/SANT-like DNA-binding domain-containing protein 4 [Pecten maximus]XP_033754431.1 myb/SANT-like DNA-binding domain-containing protein 4 [Pecten maximus]XP_033754432.1 myb/SANT-like DNA-binding domain-containing protein 4 [Pecten maximus]XP_033754433.1 myb/SANT-like DNA-binding domain-containing protein 4 [Pecten maximus]XP_033754434.1 myb/SANT-like DNA-binding domain-containing protein 4 [Pecten maximus]XP_033754435.1 myb/SANT-like DNA-binding domain-containing protein 4 [Pecten maximus]